MRLPAVLSVCTNTAWSPSARAVAAGLDTLAKAGVAAIAAAAAVVATAMAAAAVTRIAVLTKTPQVRGSGVLAPFSPAGGVRVTPARRTGRCNADSSSGTEGGQNTGSPYLRSFCENSDTRHGGGRHGGGHHRRGSGDRGHPGLRERVEPGGHGPRGRRPRRVRADRQHRGQPHRGLPERSRRHT